MYKCSYKSLPAFPQRPVVPVALNGKIWEYHLRRRKIQDSNLKPRFFEHHHIAPPKKNSQSTKIQECNHLVKFGIAKTM